MTKRPSKTLTASYDRKLSVRWAALIFLAVASLSLMVGCGSGHRPKNEQKDSRTFVTTVPNAKADFVFSKPELICKTAGGNCPEALAMLMSRTRGESENQFLQCTSFLVAPDIVATNSHCIPEDLRAPNSNCSGRIQVLFGKSEALKPQLLQCAQVLSSSEIVEDKTSPEFLKLPDYAFIKLKARASGRQPLKFSRAGLPDALPLKVLTIDPSADPESFRSTLRSITCVTAQRSLLTPGFVHDFAPVAAVSDCEAINGNSGSPMIDVGGRVRAILYGGRDPETRFSVSAEVELPDKFKHMSLASNAACLDVPASVVANKKDPRCLQNTDRVSLKSTVEKTPLRVVALVEEWKKKSPSPFEFEVKTNSAGAFAVPLPSCVKPSAQWSTQIAQPESLNLLSALKRADGTVTFNMSLPVWAVSASIDSSYRPRAASKQIATAHTNLILDLAALERGESPRINETAEAAGVWTTHRRSTSLPVCN